MKWHVYIVRCRDDSFYTGITPYLQQRVNQHNSKIGAKSLRGKLPVTLVHNEVYNNRSEALKREFEIKGWNRSKKLALISKANPEEQDLP